MADEVVVERWIADGQGLGELPEHDRGESLDVVVPAGAAFPTAWFLGKELFGQMPLLAEFADDSPD